MSVGGVAGGNQLIHVQRMNLHSVCEERRHHYRATGLTMPVQTVGVDAGTHIEDEHTALVTNNGGYHMMFQAPPATAQAGQRK
jgi:hypothetical protein